MSTGNFVLMFFIILVSLMVVIYSRIMKREYKRKVEDAKRMLKIRKGEYNKGPWCLLRHDISPRGHYYDTMEDSDVGCANCDNKWYRICTNPGKEKR